MTDNTAKGSLILTVDGTERKTNVEEVFTAMQTTEDGGTIDEIESILRWNFDHTLTDVIFGEDEHIASATVTAGDRTALHKELQAHVNRDKINEAATLLKGFGLSSRAAMQAAEAMKEQHMLRDAENQHELHRLWAVESIVERAQRKAVDQLWTDDLAQALEIED